MTRRLTDRHYDALATMVRTLDPAGAGTIADLDAVTAAAADLDHRDLDHLDSPHLDAEPAGTHPALAYVRLIEPPHIIRWYETHSSGWPPDDLTAIDAPAPQRRSVAPEAEELLPVPDYPERAPRPPSASPAAQTPLVRRFLTS